MLLKKQKENEANRISIDREHDTALYSFQGKEITIQKYSDYEIIVKEGFPGIASFCLMNAIEKSMKSE